MIKAIASDLDGTLLLHGAQSLNPEIYDIVTALQEKGIHFISASGRQIASQRRLFGPIADTISYIAENGAVCVHQNKIIASFALDTDLVRRIIHAVRMQPNCKLLLSGDTTCYIEAGDEEFANHIVHTIGNQTEIVDDLLDVKEPIVKIAVWDLSRTYAAAVPFREKFGKEIKVVTSGNDWVDFLPFDTNKGTALKLMLERLHIKPEELIAFGDQENDIEMLKLAGKSYAMASAVPGLLPYADETTARVEDTLKELLKQLD